jgi:hypothetical protein
MYLSELKNQLENPATVRTSPEMEICTSQLGVQQFSFWGAAFTPLQLPNRQTAGTFEIVRNSGCRSGLKVAFRVKMRMAAGRCVQHC